MEFLSAEVEEATGRAEGEEEEGGGDEDDEELFIIALVRHINCSATVINRLKTWFCSRRC